ncbi:MAG: ribbon-helix-helix protein, CopG family [Thermofilaceae archaeon]
MKERKRSISVRLDKETLDYVLELARECNASTSYVVRRLLEIAVRLHREGLFEFPEGKVRGG